MTLKIYVSKDSKGKEWAPDFPAEEKSIEWMLKKAWEEFHHLQATYAIIANLRHPSADMVIFTERGIGVLELKHSFGEIKISNDGNWYAGTHRIHAGIHKNPRTQAQSYATALRGEILDFLLQVEFREYLKKRDEIKFQTGVCFTNPNVNIERAQRSVEEKKYYLFAAWESDFSIIDKNGFTAWVRELRFQLQQDHTRRFEPVRLSPELMVKIITEVLGNVEWSEILPAMPKNAPYAHLILEDTDGRQVFHLAKDDILIGRHSDCDIVIPARYIQVSNKHCQITRTVSGVKIKDIRSKNGSLLNGKKIDVAQLKHGDILTLGGKTEGEKDCNLRFELRENALWPPDLPTGNPKPN